MQLTRSVSYAGLALWRFLNILSIHAFRILVINQAPINHLIDWLGSFSLKMKLPMVAW